PGTATAVTLRARLGQSHAVPTGPASRQGPASRPCQASRQGRPPDRARPQDRARPPEAPGHPPQGCSTIRTRKVERDVAQPAPGRHGAPGSRHRGGDRRYVRGKWNGTSANLPQEGTGASESRHHGVDRRYVPERWNGTSTDLAREGMGRRPTWPEQNGMSVSVPGGGRGAVTRVGRRRRGAPAGRGSLAAEALLTRRRGRAGVEGRQIGLTGLLGTAAERGPTRAGTGRGLLRGLGLLACGLGRVLGLGLLDLLLRGLPAARLLAHAHAGA